MSLGRRFSSPAAFSVGVTLAVLLVGLVVFVQAVLFRVDWANSSLASIEPRHARLLGLRDNAEAVQGVRTELEQRLAVLAYPAGQPVERVAAELQQRVRAEASGAGFTLVGSQILPARAQGRIEEVPVSIVLEGSLEHLSDFADRLGEKRPVVKLLSMTVTPLTGRGVSASRNIRVDLTVAAARLVQ